MTDAEKALLAKQAFEKTTVKFSTWLANVAKGLYPSRGGPSQWGIGMQHLDEIIGSVPPPPPISKSMLGVYTGGALHQDAVSDFEAWLGRKVDLVLDFLPGDSWTTIEGPAWQFDPWGKTDRRLVLGIPILAGGGTLAQGASGTFNTHFRNLAKNLVAIGKGNSILRLGWEFGGGWYLWRPRTATDAGSFITYWRQIVETMRSVAPDLKFDWNDVWGDQSVAPDLCYPGDAYVDFMGCDIYDQSWIANFSDPAARWQDQMTTNNYSVQYFIDFAKRHGKPFSIPEWGLVEGQGGHGGGDCPYFIQHMFDLIQANCQGGYHIYFNVSVQDGAHYLPDFPKSATLFKSLFG